ncbi:MAG: hypothetical protein AUG49_10740 [Catenulispora sp. 13_1_20CM_3_70_7]|nr:MAG: hypothetical protein AUG49_10740 [Catenulispora sp. 13_1_20CM_3_70_7]
MRGVGEHQQPGQALAGGRREVGGHHHPLRPEPVRQDAADQGEDQHRGQLRGQDEGDRGSVAVQVRGGSGDGQHGEGQRHRGDAGRRGGQQALDQDQPELADAEHGEGFTERRFDRRRLGDVA